MATIRDEINAWFMREMPGSVVARNTDCWEHVTNAVKKLAQADWAQAALPEPPAVETAVDPLQGEKNT